MKNPRHTTAKQGLDQLGPVHEGLTVYGWKPKRPPTIKDRQAGSMNRRKRRITLATVKACPKEG